MKRTTKLRQRSKAYGLNWGMMTSSVGIIGRYYNSPKQPLQLLLADQHSSLVLRIRFCH